MLKNGENFKGNAQKCIHKLNKQQTEQHCHLANLSKLFLAKSFDGVNVKQGQKFPGEKHRNLSMN